MRLHIFETIFSLHHFIMKQYTITIEKDKQSGMFVGEVI